VRGSGPGVDCAAMAASSPPKLVGRYEIHGRIAAGGMASVHFGRLHGGAGFARTVAIKRLHPHLAEDPEFLATMIDEARLVARIHHPNVVATLDVETTDGELLLVMEYVRGESLAALARAQSQRGQRVPLPIVSAIAVGALYGLHAAHEATSDRGEPLGIVHRDVSPQNILVGVDGLARVIDFGVAKAAGRLMTTREGVVKGKVAYMAPEQLAGRPVTPTADVYAMGVILWELLAGRRLFEGDSEAAVLGAVAAGSIAPPRRHVPELPAALDALVMRAVDRDAGRRFATAREMAEHLESVVAPALPGAVGAWCADVASASLARRAAALADIESTNARGHAAGAGDDASTNDGAPASNGAPSSDAAPANDGARADGGAPETDAGGSRASAIGASAVTARRAVGDDDGEPTMASQPSSLSIESSVEAREPPPRRARRAALIAAIVAAAAGAGALGLLASGGSKGTPASEAPVASDSTGAAAPRATTLPSAVPDPLEAASTPSDASPRDVAASPPAATRGNGAPAAVAPARPNPNCNPPYVFDSQGLKKWKRQCL
jgi:hypothetical protein